ncbi:DUF6463 family protein [Amycolatopsis sp. H20-H5]|uniref:DUF6463 family protein n=1 Tax=Amycolatopsis sp. H20-H5 TaxID=3046309 RepID=UPI002DB9A2A5|nr:DUF6463 family protein [Amycolatopsis sp. H20-H5]MEC3981824.1 DUF6463 family protein [Amycolatopsis sp. H20-H5]
MIKWGGWVLVVLGAGHMLITLALVAPSAVGAWFGKGVWGEDSAAMSQADAAYWLSLGSFGVPLIVIGLMVLWLDRRDIVPPSFVAWTVGIWSLLGAVIFEPAPWPIAWIAAGLLLAGARRARTTRAMAGDSNTDTPPVA